MLSSYSTGNNYLYFQLRQGQTFFEYRYFEEYNILDEYITPGHIQVPYTLYSTRTFSRTGTYVHVAIYRLSLDFSHVHDGIIVWGKITYTLHERPQCSKGRPC